MTTSDGNGGERHPESYCHECNGPNVVWFAPNDIWNKVIGSSSGILCPLCFVKRATAAGIDVAWKLVPEDHAQSTAIAVTNRREWKLGERCAHSQLGRQCEVCQRDDEIAGLRAQVEGLRERVKCEAAEVDAIHAVEMFTGHIEVCYEDQTLAECPCSKLLESMFLATAANAAARLALRTAGGGG